MDRITPLGLRPDVLIGDLLDLSRRRVDVVGTVGFEQDIERDAVDLAKQLQIEAVGQTFARFPYLKILVMYECLRLLA